MPRAFSLDLRRRILDDVLGGMTYAQAARTYSVSAEFVRRFQATREIEARPPIPRVVPFHRKHEAAIRTIVAECPSLTLQQLRVKLGLSVSIGTLWHALQTLKLTFKKKRSTRPSNSGPTSSSNGPSSASSAPPASTRIGSFSSTKPPSKPI